MMENGFMTQRIWTFTKVTTLIGFCTAQIAGQVAAAQTPCMTSSEAKSVVSAALPDLVLAISNKCKPALSADAYLNKSGSSLSGKFKSSANSAWPAAKKAVLKVGGENAQLLANLPDEASRALLSVGINAMITNGMTTEKCSVTNRILAALDPLPAANFADAMSAVIETELAKPKPTGKQAPFKICAAPVPLAAKSAPTASK
jgi:hypothetical protein